MLKERIIFFRQMEMAIDAGLAILAFYVGYPYHTFTNILPLFVIIWITLLYLSGFYASGRIKPLSDILITTWSSAFMGIGVFGASAYMLQIQTETRLFIVFIFCLAAAFISFEKTLVKILFWQVRKKGFNYRNLLLVGTGPRAQKFIELINRRSEWGLKILGLVDEDPELVGKEVKGYKVLGQLKDVADIIHDNVVDEIVFIVPRSWLYKIESIVTFCETVGIKVDIAVDVFELKFAKATQTELEDFMLLTFERAPIKEWHLFFKGVADIVVSGILLILFIPVFIVIAIAIKTTSEGPVLYKQTRCGMHGRKFVLYKFRTMVNNADQLLPQLQKNNEMKGPVFKMGNDPRITPLGKFLRKFSIDELPQLWNVFKREMSIVGPRPPLPDEVKLYDSWQRRRLSMRPGITCIWQVSGRNKITDFDEWTKLDLEYIDNWSIMKDIEIFLRTIPTVLLGIGAK